MRRTIALTLAILLTVPCTDALAQRVAGLGDDAIVIPKGVLRFRLIGDLSVVTERYGPNSELKALGADFSLDTLGVTQFPVLTNLQADLRSTTGISNFNPSLGKTVVQLSNRVETMPIVAEWGVTSRIMAGITVPIVRTKAEVFMRVNPAGNEGNVGFNPALTVTADFARDTMLVNAFGRAATQLNARLSACQGSTDPSCSSINANRTAAEALVASSQTFASGISRVYTESQFVPVAGTAAQTAIESRVSTFKTQYASFGITELQSAPTGPAASLARLTTNDLQFVLSSPLFGIEGAPLQTEERISIGDIDVAAKVLVYDSFRGRSRISPRGINMRLSLGGTVRFPAGKPDSPNNFVDIGTGDGQMDLEGRAFIDVLVGQKFWSSFLAKYVNQLESDRIVRITEQPDARLVPGFRRQTVKRDPGDIFEIEMTPRWVLNDFFTLGAHYIYRRKGEDSNTGTFTLPVTVTGYADVTLDAATLNAHTAQQEQRFGWGIGFSNLQTVERGRARIPFELSYQHIQTIDGSKGIVPKAFVDRVEARIYWRLFGR